MGRRRAAVAEQAFSSWCLAPASGKSTLTAPSVQAPEIQALPVSLKVHAKAAKASSRRMVHFNAKQGQAIDRASLSSKSKQGVRMQWYFNVFSWLNFCKLEIALIKENWMPTRKCGLWDGCKGERSNRGLPGAWRAWQAWLPMTGSAICWPGV